MYWDRNSQLFRIIRIFCTGFIFFFPCKLYNETTNIILRIRHGKFCSCVNEAVVSMEVDYKSQIHSR